MDELLQELLRVGKLLQVIARSIHDVECASIELFMLSRFFRQSLVFGMYYPFWTFWAFYGR
jgi:hypothetical protein